MRDSREANVEAAVFQFVYTMDQGFAQFDGLGDSSRLEVRPSRGVNSFRKKYIYNVRYNYVGGGGRSVISPYNSAFRFKSLFCSALRAAILDI